MDRTGRTEADWLRESIRADLRHEEMLAADPGESARDVARDDLRAESQLEVVRCIEGSSRPGVPDQR